ncbi:MAG TPA: GNAT family N-acetyltransferase [Acidimicrobiales bacterium]|nr:GNAT family N-acetyltransferase [Acidimicrobiales bacterium]
MLLRASRAEDLGPLRAFIGRCTPETLHRRFHGTGPRAIERELMRIASPTGSHRSWVVVAGDEVRGTATLALSGSGAPEMALLVEDRWFRRGIGRALVGALAAHAENAGLDTVTAWVQADNERAVGFIRAVAPRASIRFAGGAELEVRMPVPAAGSGPSGVSRSRSSILAREAA